MDRHLVLRRRRQRRLVSQATVSKRVRLLGRRAPCTPGNLSDTFTSELGAGARLDSWTLRTDKPGSDLTAQAGSSRRAADSEVRHWPGRETPSLTSFRGVIFDVDPTFSNTEQWWLSIPEDIRPRKDQPFYHLLAGERGERLRRLCLRTEPGSGRQRRARGPPAGRADLRILRARATTRLRPRISH